MSANEFLGLLVQAFFLLLALSTAVGYLRHRDSVRRDIALMFGMICTPLVLPTVGRLLSIQGSWLDAVGTLALLAHPYLMLRIVQHFRPLRTSVVRAAFISMVVFCIIAVVLPPLAPDYVQVAALIMIVYFAVVNGYATSMFVKGAWTSSGVVRQRLRFAAGGSGFLALTLLLLGVGSLITTQQQTMASVALVTAAAAGLTYYIGFLPPRWLRRSWQLGELRKYLLETSSKPVTERLNVADGLNDLCEVAVRSVSGICAVTVQPAASKGQWDFNTNADDAALQNLGGTTSAEIFSRVWRNRQPASLSRSAASDAERQLLEATNAGTLLVSPIATSERFWGLLVVFLARGSLFIDDDLELIALLSQQAAIFLENGNLVEMLHHYSGTLEQMVEERTRELAESQKEVMTLNVELEQRVIERTAQYMAVNQELEAFSYSVSHDLRAPLRSLDGFSQVLLEDYADQLDEQGTNYLNRIRANSQRMGQLIDALLQLSRLSRADFETAPVNLSELAQSIADELTAQEPERSATFKIESGLTTNGDERLLRVALTNLLSNAWKFTSQKAHSCIEFGSTEHNGKTAYFVRDNGVGFDMAYANKLFGAFQRLHRSNEFEGTGIGLATVARVIRRHGGEIWVEAALNEGASFYFTTAI